ncbi:MAG: hypothetical protein ACLFSL_03300 [Candidatus Woesearchaeota archaeon]
MKKYNIIGIHITDRIKHVETVQKILTRHGHGVSTRLGLHNARDNSPNGLIIIEVENETFAPLKKELKKIEGIEIKNMRF